jgi:hypothetical protein
LRHTRLAFDLTTIAQKSSILNRYCAANYTARGVISTFSIKFIDTEAGTLVWPNEADFDPATLYDWDKVGEAMIAMASLWPEPQRHNSSSTIQTGIQEQGVVY